MGAYTLATILTRVSNEINDSANVNVTTTQATNAIISAVEHYERERTWFNELVTRSLVTVANAPKVAVPSDLIFMDKLQLATTSTFTADTTSASATLTNASSTSGLVAGQFITGTGIPANTIIKSTTATTVVMMDMLGAAATATATATITVTATGSARYTVQQIPYEEWAIKSSTSTSTGQTNQFAYYGDQLYLFPTPGSVYALFLSYVQRLTTLSGSASNGWTNYAEPLIRARAKWDLFANLLYLPEMADAAKIQEIDALEELDIERQQRNTMGRTQAYYL